MTPFVFIKRFLPVFFLISFVFSVFNISVNGTSFYFYLIIPFIDFWFLLWFVCLKKGLSVYLSFFFVLFALSLSVYSVLRPLHVVKPILMLFCVVYLYYIFIYRYKSFRYLYVFTSISLLMAVIQFILSFAGYGSIVDPSIISKAIWGDLAIQTREGFDDGILFTYRVAGLAKEPGFFSSFLLSIVMIYFCDKNFNSKLFLIFVFVGLVISTSKITLVFVFLLSLIYFLHKTVIDFNKVNLVFGAIFVVFFGAVTVGLIYKYFGFIAITYKDPSFSETYLHRSIGYYLICEFEQFDIWNSILWGGINERLSDVLSAFPFLGNLRFVYTQPDVVFFSSNHAYIILQYGFVFFIAVLVFMNAIKIKFFGFCVFTLLIASVNMFAFENWVVLGYLFMLLNRDERNIKLDSGMKIKNDY